MATDDTVIKENPPGIVVTLVGRLGYGDKGQ